MTSVPVSRVDCMLSRKSHVKVFRQLDHRQAYAHADLFPLDPALPALHAYLGGERLKSKHIRMTGDAFRGDGLEPCCLDKAHACHAHSAFACYSRNAQHSIVQQFLYTVGDLVR